MPRKLVEQIDAQTKRQGSNRSDFVRQAVRKQLSTLERWEKLTNMARSRYKGNSLNAAEVAEIVSSRRVK